MSTVKNHLLEDMTFLEFQERMSEDPVILIPLGSQEIQGPMVPMGDFMLTREIASLVAEKTGAIAAPTMPFGYAEYFRSVPGGIALSADAFRATLRDMLDNFLDHGLTRLVILNGHSGNAPLIDQVIRSVRRDHDVLVPSINLWRSIPDDLWKELHGDFGKKAFAHGGDPITSVYLHLFPDLTRMDAVEIDAAFGKMLDLPTAGLSGVRFQGTEIALPVNVDDHCSNGIAGGDARKSSADKGARFVEHLIAFCSDFVEHMRSVPSSTKPKAKGELAK
ncbi:creatininase family protein [Nitratireductor aquimarinus]|uniref:creatininase family protein n=1 Tax=Alphaproteobacteria TaxID=28211 RepID=UPI0019D3BCF8|nr:MULTISPECIES: creatininase family protein [Alphaproteobacteria]MBN7755244.1 creatininase family protein [Nitratireductor aquimarinus]MBY5997998.1 creatininase family protein [Tritonibacter mobilis]MBY6020026.1 creatininase family protein [Nitratireductor sp. DP7N14-4]